MLYVNDGTIFATSATTKSTTNSAIAGFKTALHWLNNNSLSANLAKTKLMVFTSPHQPNLTGGKIWGAQYMDTNS